MKTKTAYLVLLFLFSNVCAAAQTTEVTYRGRLIVNGTPVSGDYDFKFTPWDSATGGNKFNTETRNSVPVDNGYYTVNLDFGDIFPGDDRFLEIMYSPAGAGTYDRISPRELITSVPYSIKSLKAANADQLGGISPGQFVQTNDSRLSDARVPLPGSSSYIQNATTQQAAANFNISGTGKANVFDAASQFNINGIHVLSIRGMANTFVGGAGGSANTGDLNTFVGNASGVFNSSGRANTFLGGRAGFSNTTGFANTYVGVGAGYSNVSGSNNTHFGADAGSFSTASGNSFFGSYAGLGNTGGSQNAFFGTSAGGSNTTGHFNTFVGTGSGFSNTAEQNNTFIGAQSDGAANVSNATAVGFRAKVTQSNSLVLGGISGINGAYADTRVGIGTTAPQFKLEVVDKTNTGLRVQTNMTGGKVASFGGNGAFDVDAPGIVGGRFTIRENGNTGIGTSAPSSRLHVNGRVRVTGGDIFVSNPNTLIITSPNGACWGITVNNSGGLSTFATACP